MGVNRRAKILLRAAAGPPPSKIDARRRFFCYWHRVFVPRAIGPISRPLTPSRTSSAMPPSLQPITGTPATLCSPGFAVPLGLGPTRDRVSAADHLSHYNTNVLKF
jgi:hypothetical protein